MSTQEASKSLEAEIEELGLVESLEVVSDKLKTPLDKSLDGMAKAFIYSAQINHGLKDAIKILVRIEALLDKARPLIFAAKWDKEMISVLSELDLTTNKFFGKAPMENTVFDVPDGCGMIWMSFLGIFYSFNQLKIDVMNEINGVDLMGTKKAMKGCKAVLTWHNNTITAANKLFDLFPSPGTEFDVIVKRAKELRENI